MAASFWGSSATVKLRQSTLVVAASIVSTSFAWSSQKEQQQTLAEQASGPAVMRKEQQDQQLFQLEVHLMDKIQKKEYMTTAKDCVPDRLRILAIDLPEVRSAFDGECRLAHDKLFLDEVAPPKKVVVANPRPPSHTSSEDQKNDSEKAVNNNTTNNRRKTSSVSLQVPQKALVKSLVQCRNSASQSKQKVGVELLEASVADLNKYRLRKIHQLGSFKYDPGKYYTDSENGKETDAQNSNTLHHQKQGDEKEDKDDFANKPLDRENFEDELEAPWNQYAWAEELRLRINGQVGFDAPMERGGRWSRMFFNQAYSVTIHSVFRFWEWPLPSFAKSNPDGIDGRYRTHHRASNKPHAVIANGAALQRVPSTMRLLQKLCKKADVPLFVVHDPRVWGGNTHETLSEAMKDMRSTIKNRVISRALEQQGSTSFSRGRIMGQLETETKWRMKEQKRKAKELFTSSAHRQQAEENWSTYDSARLERRLVQRGVIKEKTTSDGEGSSVIQKAYSKALVDLARRTIGDIEEQEKVNNLLNTSQTESSKDNSDEQRATSDSKTK